MAKAQTDEGQPTQDQSAIDWMHKVEDAQAVEKMIKNEPKKQMELDLDKIAGTVLADPRIPQELKQEAMAHPKDLLQLNLNQLDLSEISAISVDIQQAKDVSLLPIAILNGSLSLVDAQAANNPLVKAVVARAAALEVKAHSVGRIEVVQPSADSPQLVGTAFVVASGYLMTACHVVKAIAKLEPSRTSWHLNFETYVDFGASNQHSAAQEFEVSDVTTVPTILGFDVAILHVAQRSRDSSTPLPPALELTPTQTTKQAPIAVIGYPALNDPDGTPKTQEMIKRLKAGPPNVAKYVSPGQIMLNEQRSSFHILVHIGSTHSGNSGSPVFSLDPVRVVGIHYCCTGAEGAQNGEGCSSSAAAQIHSNEAISAADAKALIPIVNAGSTRAINIRNAILRAAWPDLAAAVDPSATVLASSASRDRRNNRPESVDY
jgi:V8-like Glu-specific endopeptidase